MSLFEEEPSGAGRARGVARRALTRWLPVAAVLGGCVYACRTVDRGELVAALAHVRLLPLALSTALAAIGLLAHAAFWWALVRPTAKVSLRTMADYTFASSAASVVLPLRAGEGLRVWLLRRDHGVPLARSGAVAALEKVADALALLLLVAPLPWLVSGLPSSIGHALRVLPIAVAGVVALVVVATRSGRKVRWLEGFRVAARPSLAAKGFAFILLAWVIDVGAIMTAAWALGVDPSLGTALVVLLLVNLAIAIPATPGQIGSHELGSTVALELLGVPPSHALAFAIVFHATQLAPVLLLGLVSARGLTRTVQPAALTPSEST